MGRVMTGRVPARALLYGFLNKLNYVFRTGNRRFEFERLYLEQTDPWEYRSSPYEIEKYEKVLTCILRWRTARRRLLEVGCSIGVFSTSVAKEFDAVTCIDISSEALRTASQQTAMLDNIELVKCDLRSLRVDVRYDVILCAEVLYYLPEQSVPEVCEVLDRYLDSGGLIVLVTGYNPRRPSRALSGNAYYFDDWESVLAEQFDLRHREIVEEDERPYMILGFHRRR